MSITIKQAFEKLAMVTGAAVKNPWFVGRNLNQAFADIADNIEEGGGGSTVEVAQVLESGTKVATITVDGTPTDIYAPTPNSQNYSTTEHIVGKWVDGETDVYERTYVLNNMTFSGQSVDIDVAFPANNILISAEGFVLATGGNAGASLCGIPGLDNWEFGIHLARPNLVLYAGKQASISTLTGGALYVTIRYIKVSS